MHATHVIRHVIRQKNKKRSWFFVVVVVINLKGKLVRIGHWVSVIYTLTRHYENVNTYFNIWCNIWGSSIYFKISFLVKIHLIITWNFFFIYFLYVKRWWRWRCWVRSENIWYSFGGLEWLWNSASCYVLVLRRHH